MTEEVAKLVVRLEATDTRLRAALARANRSTTQWADRTQKANTRVQRSHQRTGNSAGAMGNRIQQAGFQIGDFAVQVASGQSPLRAFIQQGTQLAGAFGPMGAAAGAAGAVIGALAMSFIDGGDAASGMATEMGTLQGAMNALSESGSRVETLNSQIAESSGEVRDALIRERDATVDLLKARLALAKETLANAFSEIDRNAVSEAVLGTQGRAAEMNLRLRMARPEGRGAARDAFLNENPQEAVRITGLQTQIATVEASLLGLQNPTQSRTGGGGSRRRGGGGSSARGNFGGAAQRAQDMIRRAEEGRRAIGLTGAALQRYQAQANAARLQRELLTAAMADGKGLSDEEREQIEALGSEYIEVQFATINAAQAMDEMAKASEDANRKQQELKDSLGQVVDRMSSAVLQADSFKDALRRVGLELGNLAIQALSGQGALGPVFNQLIGVGGGGLLGLLGPSGGAGLSGGQLASLVPSAKGNVFRGGNVTAFAKGGVVSSPTTFPMPRGVGLMGEAGPEAIMPLKRGPDGSLGVAGGGGMSISMNVVSPNADPSQVASEVMTQLKNRLPAMQRANAARSRA